MTWQRKERIESLYKIWCHNFQYGCVQLGNLDLDFKIRISDLQSNAKSQSGFQCWNICFWISFFPCNWEIWKRNWKTVPKNSRLARACIISKKKTAVHENSVANLFFGFPNRTVKRKSMKPGFGFLNWNPPWGRISRRWNLDFKIYIRISRSNATYVARNIHVI